MTEAGAGSSEKIAAAKASVWSAILLTAMKAVVGFATGSLGILAEAAHSLLDLMAAVMTLFSVRYSDRPADSEHHYGHGKIENLSALGETLLLLITCVWIGYEAVERLIREHPISLSVWGFVVMGVSIVIDWYRSRRLMKAAKKFRSQALEADALHFSSDILSSAVVIVGLTAVHLGYPKADPIAALLVAAWVVGISARLGQRAIQALLDAAPRQAREQVRAAVEKIEGIERVQSIRVRQSGPDTFADLVVMIDRRLTLEEAHRVADRAEDAVRAALPGADVVVHAEPIATPAGLAAAGGPIRESFHDVASAMGIQYHKVILLETPEGITALVDLEFPPGLPLEEARKKADALEHEVCRRAPNLQDVVAHIDVDYSDGERVIGHRSVTEPRPTREAIEREVLKVPGVTGCHEVLFNVLPPRSELAPKSRAGCYLLTLHITVAPDLTVAQSHQIAHEVEGIVSKRFPMIRQVHIHQEPAKHPSGSPRSPGEHR